MTAGSGAVRLPLIRQNPIQEAALKTYRSPRDLQAQIEQVLLRPPQPTCAPLDEVAKILSDGRHYAWIGIYLVAGQRPASGKAVASSRVQSKSRTVIPVRLGQHEFGAIEVQAESGKALSEKERILLKRVALRLAQFLHGPGACLVRKAREAAAEQPLSEQVRHQPESEKIQERTLAAGEGRR